MKGMVLEMTISSAVDQSSRGDKAARFARQVCLIWAGLSIGGVWIAAPAKFTAPSLSLATALEVGRAQFFWMNIAQLMICALLLACLGWARGFSWRVCGVAIMSFTAQLIVLAFLDRLTSDVMVGGTSNGVLHALFLALEAVKLACLLAVGFMSATPRASRRLSARSPQGKL